MKIMYTKVGKDAGQGNLLGIQPWVISADYSSPQALLTHLQSYLDCAKEIDWLNNRTIAVFPEYIGTWLVAANEGSSILSAKNTNQAMGLLVFRHPLKFAKQFLSSRAADRLSDSIFQMKAVQMAAAYQLVFGSLAKQFGITIVAGSILLPNPQVILGQISPRKGPLFNTTAVFGPDGQPHRHLVRKIYPVTDEQPFVAASPVNSLPVFDTPAGRMGVLICADSWYPQTYEQLEIKKAELIAIPSMISATGLWKQPWQGYNGAPMPIDVAPSDIGVLTEGQAWHKYALGGRISLTHAVCGINVFLHGKLWEMELDSGAALGIAGSNTGETGNTAPALINVWRT